MNKIKIITTPLDGIAFTFTFTWESSSAYNKFSTLNNFQSTGVHILVLDLWSFLDILKQDVSEKQNTIFQTWQNSKLENSCEDIEGEWGYKHYKTLLLPVIC